MAGSFTADSIIIGRQFTADAWFTGGRSRHDRTLDHFGVEDDTTMVLSGPIGGYPAGTTIHDVLADMVARIVSLETAEKSVHNFTADAFLAYYVTADSVLRLTNSDSFTADAELNVGGAFTMDATIASHQEFEIDTGAFLV